jgi:transcriptional regulator with XRE-family HTH domain
MKFENKYDVAPGVEHLFEFKNKEEEWEHEAKMIMFRFFSELEKINNSKPIKKKELAKAIGTSASFVTQLFQGDKLVNLTTLAKIQEAYDITFEIRAKKNLPKEGQSTSDRSVDDASLDALKLVV